MVLTRLVTTSLTATLAAGYLVAAPGTAFPGTVSQCSGWVEGQTGLSCAVVEEALGVTATDFETWNPMVADGTTCELLSGYDYCIQIDFGSTSTVATSTTSSSSSTSTTFVTTTAGTTTGDGITTPLPIQTGMVSTCDKFYLVASDDTCQAIADAAGISLATFYAWNPAVGTSCAYLEVGEYVCVDIIGYTISTTITPTTTPKNGISTPSPIQTGMVSNCNKFDLVQSGDTCQTIADAAGISLATFYAWNPAVGTSCAYLEIGEYVCVDIIGYTISTTITPSTTPTNGISTPSPIQTGMVSNCNKFDLVQSGDTCQAIADAAGISLATFYAWNPAVGTSCAYLEIGEYVCVDIIGYTPSATTTSSTSTTTAGNGITTPTPYESGMVTNCDKFHLVASGDTCTTIAQAAGITVANIVAWNANVGSACTGIWLGYYICTGIL